MILKNNLMSFNLQNLKKKKLPSPEATVTGNVKRILEAMKRLENDAV